MKTSVSSSIVSTVKRAVVATILAALITGTGGTRVVAQDATATTGAAGAFIETVGGETTRELPAPIYYDVDGNGSLDAGELATAVEERYPKMIWPEAYVMPLEDLLAAVEESGEASWPIGWEFRVLEVPAICAWFNAYLDAYERGDTLQQPAALDQAMYVLGGTRTLSPEESLAAVDGIRYATLGDDTLIRAYVDEGPCQDEAWFETGATPVASPVSRVKGVMR